MFDKDDISMIDCSITANELHDTIVKLYEMYEVDNVLTGVSSIVKSFSNIEDDYILSKSYDFKEILLSMKSNEEAAMMWDAEWKNLIETTNYIEFIEECSHRRNAFQSIRVGYLANQVAFKTLKEPPKTFGVIQLIAEKYIKDLIHSDENIHKHTVTYEDFDGNICKKVVRVVKPTDYDILDSQPENHWVGKTVFDSFLMMAFFDDAEERWIHIPIDLIQSVMPVFDNKRFGGEPPKEDWEG